MEETAEIKRHAKNMDVNIIRYMKKRYPMA